MDPKVFPSFHEIWAFFTNPAKKRLEEKITAALLEDIKLALAPATTGSALFYVRYIRHQGAKSSVDDVHYQLCLDQENTDCANSYKYYHGMAFENLIESVLKSASQDTILRKFACAALDNLIITRTVIASPKGGCYLLSPGALETLGYATRINSTQISNPAINNTPYNNFTK